MNNKSSQPSSDDCHSTQAMRYNEQQIISITFSCAKCPQETIILISFSVGVPVSRSSLFLLVSRSQLTPSRDPFNPSPLFMGMIGESRLERGIQNSKRDPHSTFRTTFKIRKSEVPSTKKPTAATIIILNCKLYSPFDDIRYLICELVAKSTKMR